MYYLIVFCWYLSGWLLVLLSLDGPTLRLCITWLSSADIWVVGCWFFFLLKDQSWDYVPVLPDCLRLISEWLAAGSSSSWWSRAETMYYSTWLSSADIWVVGCWLFFLLGLLMVQSSSSMLVLPHLLIVASVWKLAAVMCSRSMRPPSWPPGRCRASSRAACSILVPTGLKEKLLHHVGLHESR